MKNYITYKAKENDAIIKVFVEDNSIDEINLQIEGEKSWIKKKQ